MKKAFLLFPLSLILISNAYSQGGPGGGGNGDRMQATSFNTGFSSPTAASIAKFTEIPMAYSTGAPSISVPLHGGDIPLTLQYNASGIRVQELPGWVGLGWSLNAGGVITRTVYGLPDDVPNGFYHEGNQTRLYANGTTSGTAKEDFQYDVASGILDSEPDLFTISAPGISGTFVFDDQGVGFGPPNIVQLPHSNMVITVQEDSTSEEIDSFTILSENGTKYVFSEKEGSFISTYPSDNAFGGVNNSVNYTSSWYLTSVVYPDRDTPVTITYNENQDNIDIDNILSETWTTVNPGYNYNCSVSNVTTKHKVRNRNKVWTKRVDQITTATETIEFEVNESNSHINNIRLDSIVVRSKQGVNKKTIVLSYLNGMLGGRQALEEVVIKGAHGKQNPPYTFEYYNTGSSVLPSRTSYDVDYWGYYNGANNGSATSLIPEVSVDGYNFTGIDREPDGSSNAVYSRAGTLKKMTYPTGGYSSFEYEPNEHNFASSIKKVGGIRVKKITLYDGISSVNNIVKEYKYRSSLNSSLSSGHAIQGNHVPYHKVQQGEPGYDINCETYIRNTNAHTASGPVVVYSEVQEYINSSANTDGYSNIDLTVSSANNGRHSYSWRRGKVLNRKEFNSDDSLITEQINTYNFDYAPSDFTDEIWGVEIQVDETFCGGLTECPAYTFDDKRKYKYYGQFNVQTSSKTKVYEGLGSFAESGESFTYEDLSGNNDYQLTRIIKTNSSQDTVNTNLEYAHENQPLMRALSVNMLSQTYAVSLTNTDGIVLAKHWTEWAKNGVTENRWQPVKSWQWTGGATTTPDSTNAVKVSEVLDYDNYGNPLEVEDVDGATTKYFYGSNGSPYTQIGNVGINGVYLTGVIKIQNGIDSQLCNGDDLCTNASYDNFGNLISITDESGYTTNFEYDSINRLISQSNTKGVFTSEYIYSYSSELNGGVYDSGSPNKVETITFVSGEGYIEPTSAAGMSKWGGSTTYDYLKEGIRTMKVGYDGSGWDGFRKYSYFTKGVAKADIYIDPSVSSGAAHPFYIRSSNGYEVLSLRYSPSETNFSARIKHNNSWNSPVTLNLVAEEGKWYTVELVRGDDPTKADLYIYPKGGDRDVTVKYAGTGFPSSWSTHIQSSGGLSGGNYYVGNISMGEQQRTVQYLDGLGRSIQTQVRGGSSSIITDTRYNERGLPEVSSRPFELSNQTTYFEDAFEGSGSFTPGGSLDTTSEIESEYQPFLNPADTTNGDDDYAYSQVEYEDSPLARTEKSTLPGATHKMGSDNEITTTYGLNTTEVFTINEKMWGTNTLNKTVSRDPEGNETITYTDGWGQTIVSGVNMNPSSDDLLDKTSADLVTYFEYDLRGNLVRVEDPRGLATTYTYDARGLLTGKKLPDQTDSINYIYDDKGRLRFTENAEHKKSGSSVSVSFNQNDSDLEESITTSKFGKLTFDFYVVLIYDDYNTWITDFINGNEKLVSEHTEVQDMGPKRAKKSLLVQQGSYKLFGEPQNTLDDNGDTYGAFKFEPFKYSYTKYDDLDRPTEIGEYYGSTAFRSADANNQSFPSSNKQALVNYYYDEANACSGADNLEGRLAKVLFADPNDLDISGKTCYSYNSLGLIEWVSQKIPGMSEKHIRYTYDDLSQVTRIHFDPSGTGDDHYIWYEYDEFGRLEFVKSYGSNNESSALTEAQYTYYADGQVKQMILGDGAQTIDYDYTVQGWMSAINDGNISGKDKFGMSLVYELNGNIGQQQWRQAGHGTALNTYTYGYDEANRLESADFLDASYYDATYSYDDSGNIDFLARNSSSTGVDKEYHFSFFNNTNRIEKICVNPPPGGSCSSPEYKYFDYDAMGNTIQSDLQGLDNTSYDWRNLPTWMVANGDALLYTYDADGQRVKKQVVDGSTIYYIRGVDGQTIAAYDGNGDILFINILAGGDIIGQIEPDN